MNRYLAGVLVFCIVGMGSLAVTKAPEYLRQFDFFRAKTYQVLGNQYLKDEMILEIISFSSETSVLDDFSWVEILLEQHEMILEASVDRNWWTATVSLTVEEKIPLALIAEPLLVPVDREGHILPLDPGQHRLNLPLIRVTGDSQGSSEELQIKAMALELERLGSNNPLFTDGLSEISIDKDGNAEATLERDVVFRFRPPLQNQRLNAGLAALEDLKSRKTVDTGIVIDLRFEDQVVVSYEEGIQ